MEGDHHDIDAEATITTARLQATRQRDPAAATGKAEKRGPDSHRSDREGRIERGRSRSRRCRGNCVGKSHRNAENACAAVTF
jgi:hypothetical protein